MATTAYGGFELCSSNIEVYIAGSIETSVFLSQNMQILFDH